ncbi:uncharacterized protein J3R85_014336 [Psidium guajava]|nr:uncharacterized protein J3R85_014336 [Psidium guajava]
MAALMTYVYRDDSSAASLSIRGLHPVALQKISEAMRTLLIIKLGKGRTAKSGKPKSKLRRKLITMSASLVPKVAEDY